MWYYTQHDIALAKGAVLRLSRPEKEVIQGVGGTISTGNIEFQFPPKVISDSRRGSWEEGELRGNEPVAAFKTSGPREITLSWSYVVDSGTPKFSGYTAGPSVWTIDRITKNIRTLRGYYALVREAGDSRKNLVVEFRLWAIGGLASDKATDTITGEYNKDYFMSARINSIDVKYGDTIVCPSGNVQEAFFLRTDITVDLRLWTKIGTRTLSDAATIQSVEAMRDYLTPSWY